MTCSLQKTVLTTAVGLALAMLAACSSDQQYKRQVIGNEDYLNAPPLKPLVAPAGITLPAANSGYNVPPMTATGAVGKQLDIRPPLQPLALLSGSRAQYANGSATLLFENTAQNQNLWSRITHLLTLKDVPVAARDNGNQTLTTDWVQWDRLDEDHPHEGRYQISVQQQGYQQVLMVRSLELRQQGQSVIAAAEVQRYTSMMMNSILEGLENQNSLGASAESRSAERLSLQSGADDTGLPLLIVRAPYSVVWERLPAALEKLGMQVRNRSRSDASLNLTYNPLTESEWRALGVADPQLESGNYKLQLGDLNNRTSVQFFDEKGKTLTLSQNDALLAALQAAFDSGTLE
ncbi:outer membrane protein assembly factor BamC [Serratia microhaemolytica]|uniref:outer membrane protein assembly factor BamC n=1 Tax=Serratia microhaemolytica TaxID=2675110 RepID=UPI000FDE9B9E|nr:outer membrane protein assembly factor BamC [Serratia microhaemolytica]